MGLPSPIQVRIVIFNYFSLINSNHLAATNLSKPIKKKARLDTDSNKDLTANMMHERSSTSGENHHQEVQNIAPVATPRVSSDVIDGIEVCNQNIIDSIYRSWKYNNFFPNVITGEWSIS